MMLHATHHEFALYCPNLQTMLTKATGQKLLVHDELLCHRIAQVLRLKPGETFVLFDCLQHVVCRLDEIAKKNSFSCALLEQQPNVYLKPSVTMLLPLLKRDDLETALYAMVELGATAIQLVLTQKVQRPWGGEKEFERLQRVMIAAAEQSKNFAVPELKKPMSLDDVLQAIPSATATIFFDSEGASLLEVAQQCMQQMSAYALLVGPEGDLTDAEKEAVQKAGFISCALTPTVLRSVQAVALGLGVIRSLVPFSR